MGERMRRLKAAEYEALTKAFAGFTPTCLDCKIYKTCHLPRSNPGWTKDQGYSEWKEWFERFERDCIMV